MLFRSSDVTASFSYVEKYKKIAAAVMKSAERHRAKVIMISSVAEHEGKSTVAANLALTMQAQGKKVLLVDCDMRRPSQAKIFGITVEKGRELTDLLSEETELTNDILYRDENTRLPMGALAAGVNLVCGYPGTPSTEVLETVAKNRGDSVYVEWSVNEKTAMEVAAGTSYAGARALVTMKQMGLNVASDPLMCLEYIGVKGGLVVLVADDPGPISSQTEQDTRSFEIGRAHV